MGYDDTGVLVHTNIKDTQAPGPLAAALSMVGTFTMNRDITFTGNRNDRNTVLMTITEDGKLLPGPGLTAEVASQQVAGQLVRHFAVEINAKIREAQAAEAEAKQKLVRVEAELMAMSERAKHWEWQFTDADRKLGELMLQLTAKPVSPFTDDVK
jgi:hypothetical protein